MTGETALDKWMSGLSRIVTETLWREWDPCDVNYEPDTIERYAEFAPGVMRLLLNGAPAADIADYLWRMEEDRLKLSVSTSDPVSAANALIAEARIYSTEHPHPDLPNSG